MNRRLVFGLLVGAMLLAGQALAATALPPRSVSATSYTVSGVFRVNVSPSSTAGVTYVFEENANGAGYLPLSGCAATYCDLTRGAGTYRYRAAATRVDLTQSDWVTTPADTVVAPLTYCNPPKISVASYVVVGNYRINLTAPVSTTGGTYEIEESSNGGANWSQIYSGTNLYFNVTNKVNGTYVYRARTTKPPTLTPSTWANAPAPTVVNIPPALLGTAACVVCHTAENTAWAASLHGNGNGTPGVSTSNTCMSCHDPNKEGATLGKMAIGCEGCHGTGYHPATRNTAAIASCAKCHNSHFSAQNTIASGFAASTHATSLLPAANLFDTDKCVTCHDPHALTALTTATCTTSCHTAVSHAANLPNCLECHNPHSVTTAMAIPASDITPKISAHALTGQVAVSNVVVTIGGANVTMTFNVKLDGVNADNFTFNPAGYWYKTSVDADGITGTAPATYPITEDFTRVLVVPSVISNGSGNYTATWASIANNTPTGVATLDPKVGNVTFLASVYNAAASPRQQATAVGYLNGKPRDLASNDGCIGCHGNNAFQGNTHFGANPQGVDACVVCHTRGSSVSRGAGGDRLTAYVHGIHASEQAMPAGGYDRSFPPVVPRVPDFKVTYPSYMTNCAVCHSTPAQLATVNAALVSYSLCFSCHDEWTSFGDGTTVFGGEPHGTFDWNENCAGCHDGTYAGDTVSDFHNGLLTERSGLIYNGADVSVVEGAKINMQITGVTRTPDNADADTTDQLVVTWTATYDADGAGGAAPVAVNPCNTTVAVGAPIFHAGGAANTTTGQAAQNMSILRAYAQGDDWVNAGIGTVPGQPLSTNLVTTPATTSGYTTCSANVATTNILMSTAEHALTTGKGVVALQGKPQINVGYSVDSPVTPAVETRTIFQVRAKTPTREFVVADGALPATLRRAVIDSANCLKCHVGSMYQHGGNRVDNIEMCFLCHNEASNEKNVRLTTDGVTASEAYDGKVGQTYGFKSLLHAVHSAGETGAITEVHRTNGIYVFTGENTVIPNWPGTGPQTVYGSIPAGTNPLGTTRTHYLYHPTYPQPLQNCAACHKPGTFGLPDPTKAVATTLDAGNVSSATANANQLDDVLQGPAAAACMSCHQSGDKATQAKLTAHASQGGFAPAVLPNGRADVLNGVKVENCSRCH